MSNQVARVTYSILTRDRVSDVVENLESIRQQRYSNKEIILVINGYDRETVNAVTRGYPEVKLIQNKTNLGVAGGRNCGLRAATGDVIIEIDDDAILKDPDATQRVMDEFEANHKMAVLAFQERSYFSPNKIIQWGFPGRTPQKDGDKKFETYYFPGAGHAFRAEVLKKTGIYPDRYFFTTEEKDLSYRMVDRGYEIWYIPQVKVFHKVSPKLRNYNRGYHELRNHIWFGMRHLSWPRATMYAGAWIGYVTVRSFPRRLPFVGRAIRDAWSQRVEILKERHPIKRETIKKMKKLRPMRGDLRKRIAQIKNLLR